MKKKFKLLLAIFLISALSVLSIPINGTAGEGKPMTGITAIPSFSGPGLGARSWSSPKIGWGFEVIPSWEFNDFNARARFMYTLQTLEKTRWYGLLTLGYLTVNESDKVMGADFDYSVSMPTFSFGVGFEKLMGFKKNKGLAFEAGFQIGSGDYSGNVDYMGMSIPFSGTFKVSPIYLGGSFTYYFKK